MVRCEWSEKEERRRRERRGEERWMGGRSVIDGQ